MIVPNVASMTKLPAWSISTPTFSPSSPNKAIKTGNPTKEVLHKPAVRINAPTVDESSLKILPIKMKNTTANPKTMYVTING